MKRVPYILGRRSKPSSRPTQTAVLTALADGPKHVSELARAAKKSVNAVQKILWVLSSRDQIQRCARGTYRLPVPGEPAVIRNYSVAQVHAVMADLVAGASTSRAARVHGVREKWVETLVLRPIKVLQGEDAERYRDAIRKVRQRRANPRSRRAA